MPKGTRSTVDRPIKFPNELCDLGLLGITVPEVYGGSEMSYRHLVSMEEIQDVPHQWLSYDIIYVSIRSDSMGMRHRNRNTLDFVPEFIGALAMSEPGAPMLSDQWYGAVRSGTIGLQMEARCGLPMALMLMFSWFTCELLKKTRAQRRWPHSWLKKTCLGSLLLKNWQIWHARINTCELVFEDCIIPMKMFCVR